MLISSLRWSGHSVHQSLLVACMCLNEEERRAHDGLLLPGSKCSAFCIYVYIYPSLIHCNAAVTCCNIRIKSGEPCFPGFSVPGAWWSHLQARRRSLRAC